MRKLTFYRPNAHARSAYCAYAIADTWRGLRHVNKGSLPSMADIPCLGCNESTEPHYRRLLTGDKSTEACAAWREILELKQEEGNLGQADLERIVAVAADPNIGFVCTKCFSSFKRYHNVKSSLLTNINLVISSRVQLVAGSKRVRNDSEALGPPAKVPRLSFARRQLDFTSQSPSVVVGTYIKHLIEVLIILLIMCRSLLGTKSPSHLC